jgi:hypothetical protein
MPSVPNYQWFIYVRVIVIKGGSYQDKDLFVLFCILCAPKVLVCNNLIGLHPAKSKCEQG